MSVDLNSSYEDKNNTPRYFYARERSPLWSNYRTLGSIRASEISRRIGHIATPTGFTERRLQNKNQQTETHQDPETNKNASKNLKCLNCGLKGHTILKCDKISRFNDLSCREPSNYFSDSEESKKMFRRSFSSRGSADRNSSGCFSIQKDISVESNNSKMTRCRLCGLKGHLSLNCHRNSSPNHKKWSIPFPSHLSYVESPLFLKKNLDSASIEESDYDSPSKSTTQGANFLGASLPASSLLQTPLKFRQDLSPISDNESPSTMSLPSRFKRPKPKRVRIDVNGECGGSVPWRPALSGAETDNDSGLGVCSSDADTNPLDMFEILENSIKQYEKEFEEKLHFDLEHHNEPSDITNGQLADELNLTNGDTKTATSHDKPEKKLHKLRLKLIKSWFKKSTQNK